MSSSDFIEISAGSPGLRTERLFKAAISAFASLTRPSRNEATQLEDLALPLLPAMPAETLRFACAALSDCPEAPAGLIRRLADQPASICAPLLVRSRVLTDIDLVTLIGRHGLPHALAIARRPNLNADLLKVVQALVGVGRSATAAARNLEQPSAQPIDPPRGERIARTRVDEVREDLRAMMTPASTATRLRSAEDIDWERAACGYPRLLSTAMTGHRALFQTAIADFLDLDFGSATELVDAVNGRLLVSAFRALDLSPEQAFLLFALIYPGGFDDLDTIRGFIDRFNEMDIASARGRISALRRETRPARPRLMRGANDRAAIRPSLTA